ncbi:MAG: lytic transglycosylase domain-containing protein [Deltaproteobacteria bacterium]|nr:lytic transglycosylase domain-containing protein [Deltaproteobacteria bacterium]
MSKNVQAARRENDYDSLILKASEGHGVPVALIKAIIRTESNFNPEAVNPADPSAGLMQTTPPTARAMLGRYVSIEDLKDPATSIEAGARFLSHLIKHYPLEDAIQMYNLGETKFLRKGIRAPEYLERVKGFLAHYSGR